MLSVFLLAGGCGTTTSLQSQSADRAVSIDGQMSDWQGVLKAMEDEEVSLGVMNDGEFLYVSMVVNDAELAQQVMRRGLILWLDGTAEEKKAFGIQYPLGRAGGGGSRGAGGGGGASLARMQLLNEGQSITLPARGRPGLQAEASFEHGLLTYELKVPLRTDGGHDYAVGAAPGAKISLGMAMPEQEDEGLAMTGSGSGRLGGRADRGGTRRRGGRRQGRQRSPSETPPSLEFWTTVALAG